MGDRIEQPHELLVVRAVELSSTRSVIWALIVLFAVADIGLTLYGLELCFRELNPVAATALEHVGAGGLFLLKTSAIVVVAGVSQLVTGQRRLAALLGFCLPQAAVVGVNSANILMYASQCVA